MGWTTPADKTTGDIVSATDWNNANGETGNSAYLKGVCDAPMKAQGDGGSIYGGRAKLNFISGTNLVVTVADDSGNDRVNVTLAASGGTVPTLGTDVSGLISLTDPGSYPNWSAWAELIASTAAASQGLIVTTFWNGGGTCVSRLQFGTGASPTAKLDFLPFGGSGNAPPMVVPFSIAISTKISVRGYYTAASTSFKANVTVLS
jgi:hypothetical protein